MTRGVCTQGVLHRGVCIRRGGVCIQKESASGGDCILGDLRLGGGGGLNKRGVGILLECFLVQMLFHLSFERYHVIVKCAYLSINRTICFLQ